MRRQNYNPYFTPVVTGQALHAQAEIMIDDQLREKYYGAPKHTPSIAATAVTKKSSLPNRKADEINDKEILQAYDGLSKHQKQDYAATTLAKPLLLPFKHLKKCLRN